MTCLYVYPQKDIQKRKILLIEEISISYVNPRLYVDVNTNKPVYFQLWNGDKLILNAAGSAKGEEFFPVIRGKFKFILFYEDGKSKSKKFRI